MVRTGNQTFNRSYAYDTLGRLASMSSPSDPEGCTGLSWSYDRWSNRTDQTVTGGSCTPFHALMDGNNNNRFAGGVWSKGYVYLNGQLLAQYANDTTYFVHTDHLGSTRLITGIDQSVCDSLDYYPFGEQVAGDTCTTHKFTGQERDDDAGGNDNFVARLYTSTQGRFLSPDPLEGSASDPQTLNRYAYVRNNPLTLTDPTGLCRNNGRDVPPLIRW